ncbi:Glycerol-3-phosphate acyltransferase [Candidatus Entotheonellaceae bacterium PAL068K]
MLTEMADGAIYYTDLALLVGAYLLGSISFGLLIARLRGGTDPRLSGSGNIGATNVARTQGKIAGLLTLLGDAAKGFIAVLLAQWLGSTLLITTGAALSVVLGHMFPLYHGFCGGRGVATALGVFVPLLPAPLLAGCVVWLAVVIIWRYVSVGSMLAAIVVPLVAALRSYPALLVSVAGVIAVLVLVKHRSNIQRLLQGQESKL